MPTRLAQPQSRQSATGCRQCSHQPVSRSQPTWAAALGLLPRAEDPQEGLRRRRVNQRMVASVIDMDMDDSLPGAPALETDRNTSFEGLASTSWSRLVATAAVILDDHAAAEDVAQESLELAWRKWISCRDPAKREQWLLQICVRRALSWRRTRLRRTDLWHRLVEAGPVALADLPGDADIGVGFGRCTPRQRAVLVLHFFHGYTLDECAGLLGCRPGTARSHLARALTTIRRSLSS